MRSAIIAAAFAATAIAVPLQQRGIVYATDVEMVYVTEYYTVTADGAAPAPTKEATHDHYHYNLHPHWWNGPHTYPSKHHTKEPVPAPAPAPSPGPEPSPAPEPTTSDWSQPAPTSQPPSEPPSSGPAPSDYQGKVLYHHNAHRKNHTSPDIQWSSSLAATAQKIAETCKYAHNV